MGLQALDTLDLTSTQRALYLLTRLQPAFGESWACVLRSTKVTDAAALGEAFSQMLEASPDVTSAMSALLDAWDAEGTSKLDLARVETLLGGDGVAGEVELGSLLDRLEARLAAVGFAAGSSSEGESP